MKYFVYSSGSFFLNQLYRNFLIIMLIHCCIFWNPFFQNYLALKHNDHDFEIELRVFLILGDGSVFKCIEYYFISGTYWKIQVLSQVIIILKKARVGIKFLHHVSTNFLSMFILLWCET